jgi:hypothetical protein
MDPTYLRITSTLIPISFIYFLLFSKRNAVEILLSGCLFLIFISAQMFWSDPVKNSSVHMFDSITTKTTIFCFVLYTVTQKLTSVVLAISYAILLFAMSYFFYLSHFYSTNEWCCDRHIIYHGFAHMFCFISSLFAFI